MSPCLIESVMRDVRSRTVDSPVIVSGDKPNAAPRRAARHKLNVEANRQRTRLRLDENKTIVAPQGNSCRRYAACKRAFDLVGGLALLVALSPVMFVTLVVLTITTKGRPLYRQQRIGFLGKRFTLWKFRTMRLDADKIQAAVKNEQDGPIFKNRRDPRVTRIGRWLRKLSIDETLQLFNVLGGSMSLVGPRPPIAKEVAQYEPWQLSRLAIMPGLTCLWQVSGRSDIAFRPWVRMDIWYANNQSLKTDLSLLWRTPISVITGRGAY